MSHSHQRPRQDDVVLGGQTVVTAGSLVLGGLQGVQQRAQSSVREHRIAALKDALNYGEAGLAIIIEALTESDEEIQQTAFHLLRDRPEPEVKRALEPFSAIGINYMRLRNLLAAGHWQQADQETHQLLFKALGSRPMEHMLSSQIADLPCEDLRIVNHLWTKFSQGRFGFSVQQALWQQYDRIYWNKSYVWSLFADRVGWRINGLFHHNHWKRYDEITFSLQAPVGHLPFLGDRFGIFTVESFAHRLSECSQGPQAEKLAPEPEA